MVRSIKNLIQGKAKANRHLFEITSCGSIGLDRVFSVAFRNSRWHNWSLDNTHDKKTGYIGKLVHESGLLFVLTAPVIWSVVIPLALLDLMATWYQNICFPVYGIEPVNRSNFIIFDRHKLPYLSWIEKLNCTYCSYGNGVLAYVREIASRTEEYWCPIKNSRKAKNTHQRYDNFSEYGDAEGYFRIKDNSKSV
ncbi:MAG: hypothetical protein HQL90_06740 [Magnetococcales bacterium]|nr:hypothetical protein [Magnetococcales bacterium]